MATLVLSTAGTILGGPVGGAIGSLLGQSIDQQLFGPGPRHGPRIGDLAVQSSAYGTAIPRLFGTIRVAGSIIWSTELKEDSQTQGAKGQPDSITYSYSVSFAVALSCRKASQIKRIWADGKLLRGAAGDFKVATTFRFHPGDEDQPVDPLIASIEGIGETPAYRGLAVAVFEDLQLAEYGNRIPFLTFEVEADAEALTLGDLLAEASDGVVECAAVAELPGYAAHGSTIEAAIEPLVEHFGVELFDNGERLRSPTAGLAEIAEQELGCSATGEPMPRTERTQAAARSLPSVLTLNYYDPERDYQAAQMRASIGGPPTTLAAEQLPAVLGSDAARALAETSLARRWAQRDRMTLRLPPGRLGLEPGMLVRPTGEADPWVASRVAIDGLVVVAELRPVVGALGCLPADPGRSLPAKDIVAEPTIVALVELPDSGTSTNDAPVVLVASAGTSASSRTVPVELDVGGSRWLVPGGRRQAVLGHALTALRAGQSALLDMGSSVEVELVGPDDWLASCDDAALGGGANLAMLGSELIQFGEAVGIAPGRFRLSRLLRGRRGSEWAMASHAAGEPFLFLETRSIERIDLTHMNVGAQVTAIPRGIADAGNLGAVLTVSGEAMRPPSPVHLSATIDANGDLRCSWCRRSRPGWAWADGVDAPLGAAAELYRVALASSASAITLETAASEASFTAVQVASLGGGPLDLSVVQVGDLAVSRTATLAINQD